MSRIPPDPDTERLWAEMEEQAYWEAREDEAAKQREQEEAAREEERIEAAVEAMTEWFHENFEDPQNELPRDEENDSFIFLWGGPFEARDVLYGRFGDEYGEEEIGITADNIERFGPVEWAPQAGSPYYEPNDDHVDEEPEVAQSEAIVAITQTIQARLDALEFAVTELKALPRAMGHNAPPAEIGLPPYDDETDTEVRELITNTRIELKSPDAKTIQTLGSRFKKLSAKILGWLGKKADLAVEEIIRNSIKGATVLTVATHLDELGNFLQVLARLLGKI